MGQFTIYCLATDCATSADVQKDLSSIAEKGTECYEQYLNEYKEDPKHYDKPIKYHKVKNFASDTLKTRVPSKNKNQGDLLCSASIWLTSFPCWNSESRLVITTDFSSILTVFRSQVSWTKWPISLNGKTRGTEPTLVDICFIDTMFILHTLPELPLTFLGITKGIIQQACFFAKVVHIVCGTYREGLSIKEYEWDKCGNCLTAHTIVGSSQRRVTDFHKSLLAASFKTALLSFLRDEWICEIFAIVGETYNLLWFRGKLLDIHNSPWKYSVKRIW